MYQVLKGKKATTLSAYEPKRSFSGRWDTSGPAKAGALRLVIIAAHPNGAQSRWRGDPLPATVIIVAVAAPPVRPPWPAGEEDPAMHEMPVSKERVTDKRPMGENWTPDEAASYKIRSPDERAPSEGRAPHDGMSS